MPQSRAGKTKLREAQLRANNRWAEQTGVLCGSERESGSIHKARSVGPLERAPLGYAVVMILVLSWSWQIDSLRPPRAKRHLPSLSYAHMVLSASGGPWWCQQLPVPTVPVCVDAPRPLAVARTK